MLNSILMNYIFIILQVIDKYEVCVKTQLVSIPPDT